MSAYYNEIDPFAAEWLRALMRRGLIPDGEIDTRSIVDVRPDDLRGFRQCHFFAGVAGWSHALRLAGWPDDRPIWTGSCPCQPFSVAGKGKGTADERHLWPVFFGLIRACRPPVVVGEQVAGKAGYAWFDGVAADLEGEGYASRAVDIPACAIDAPHIRQRLYWCAVADADRVMHDGSGNVWSRGRHEHTDSRSIDMADADEPRLERRRPAAERAAEQPVGPDGVADPDRQRQSQRPQFDGEPEGRLQAISGRRHAGRRNNQGFWSDAIWLTGADGKARRAQSGVRLLAHGVPNRVGRLRGYGNAIVPPLAAEVICALMEVLP